MAYGGTSFGNNGIGSNNSTITYCDATFQYNIISYPDIISYNRISSGLVMNGFNVQLRSNSLIANLSNSPL